MKLLLVVHGLPPFSVGGTERVTLRLARALAKTHEVTLFYPLPDHFVPGTEYIRLEGGLRLVGRAFSRSRGFRATYRHAEVETYFGGLLRRLRPDLCHIHHLIGLSIALPGVAKRLSVPVVVTLHDHWMLCPRGQRLDGALKPCAGPGSPRCAACLSLPHSPEGLALLLLSRARAVQVLPGPRVNPLAHRLAHRLAHPLAQHLEKRLQSEALTLRLAVSQVEKRRRAAAEALRACTFVTAPSRFLLETLPEEWVSKERRYHLPNSAEVAVPPLASPRSRVPLRVGVIGAIIPSKGLHVLLEAIDGLSQVELHVVGPSPPYPGFPNYPLEMKAWTLRSGGVWHGVVSPERVRELLSGWHLLLVPSIWPENAPLVVMEALRAGVPVMASRVGGIPELIRDRQNGWLVPPGDILEWRKALARVLERPDALDDVARGAVAQGAVTGGILTPEEEARAWETLYHRCLLE